MLAENASLSSVSNIFALKNRYNAAIIEIQYIGEEVCCMCCNNWFQALCAFLSSFCGGGGCC